MNPDVEPNPEWVKLFWIFVLIDCTAILILCFPLVLLSGRVRRNLFCVRCAECNAVVRKKWGWRMDVWSE